MPEEDKWVLVYSDTGDVEDFPFDMARIINCEWQNLGWYYPGRRRIFSGTLHRVTHWMPLPPEPDGFPHVA